MKIPNTLKIAVAMLVLLSLFSAGFGLARQFGLLNAGFNRAGLPQFVPGQPGQTFNRPSDGSGGMEVGPLPDFQGGQRPDFQGRQRPDFQGGQPPDFQGSGGDMSQFFPQGRNAAGSIAFSLTRLVTQWQNLWAIGAGILGLVAAAGLWKAKRWAAILAVVVCGALLLLSIPSFLAGRLFMLGLNPSTLETLGRLALSLAVIVLVLLPSSRRAFTRTPTLSLVDDDDEEDEDALPSAAS